MALIHTIIETRPESNRWLTILDVSDSDAGRVYNHRFQSKTEPDAARLDYLATLAKTRVQDELDMDANAMNLTTDEDRLLEYYRNIKTDIILSVRGYAEATLQEAVDYISNKYPDSPFDFAELYDIWKKMIGVNTWQQFKTWVITHKFRDID